MKKEELLSISAPAPISMFVTVFKVSLFHQQLIAIFLSAESSTRSMHHVRETKEYSFRSGRALVVISSVVGFMTVC
jgi:hypothetical protein